jgi:hypothetical protein
MQRPKFTSEIILILTSFLISTAVWLVAKQHDLEKKIVTAEVVARDIPPNLEIKFSPKVINISVQYPRTYAHLIQPDAFSIELKGITENFANALDFKSTMIQINVQNIVINNLPETVRAISVSKKFVSLKARLYTRKSGIGVVMKGKPAKGFRLIEDMIKTEPKTVLLTGPPEAFSIIADSSDNSITLDSEELDIEGKNENFFQEMSVPLPEDIKFISGDSLHFDLHDKLKVKVHVAIEEMEQEKIITNVPIVIKTFSKQLKPEYSPRSANVTVKAPISILKELNRESFIFIPRQPLEETEGYSADIAIDIKFSDKVSPSIKDETSILSYTPSVINIKIAAVKNIEKKEESIPIENNK